MMRMEILLLIHKNKIIYLFLILKINLRIKWKI